MRLKSFQSLSGKITNWVFFIGLPLLLAVVLLMFYFSWRTDQRIENIASSTKAISGKVRKLSKANKNLSLENRQLAKDNKAYTLCTAKLFAKYTRDNQPILIRDLKKCDVDNVGSSQTSSSSSNQSNSSPTKTTSKPKSSPDRPKQPNQPKEPEEPPSLLDQVIDVLGL